MQHNVNTLADFLATTVYFQDVPSPTVHALAMLFEVSTHEAGALLFVEGDPGDGWYLILAGEVSIARGLEGTEPPHTLASLEPGEGFGEMALLEDAPRMASALALTPVVVARLPRSAFHHLLAEHHPGAARLLQQMAVALCRRLREVTGILQDIVDDPLPLPTRANGLDNLIRAVMAQN